MKLDREQTISLAALALLLVLCAALVQFAMQTRADAARELAERQETVTQLEARARANGKRRCVPPCGGLIAARATVPSSRSTLTRSPAAL